MNAASEHDARTPIAPGDANGPVFAETWQADAFALMHGLVDAGVFTLAEWSTALGSAIAMAQQAGDPDLGDTYYEHWTVALESLCTAKGLLTESSIIERHQQWESAYERTPHGQPVEL